jgi:hypothetical protein
MAYAYGADDPVLTADPSGLCAVEARAARELASAGTSGSRPLPPFKGEVVADVRESLNTNDVVALAGVVGLIGNERARVEATVTRDFVPQEPEFDFTVRANDPFSVHSKFYECKPGRWEIKVQARMVGANQLPGLNDASIEIDSCNANEEKNHRSKMNPDPVPMLAMRAT